MQSRWSDQEARRFVERYAAVGRGRRAARLHLAPDRLGAVAGDARRRQHFGQGRAPRPLRRARSRRIYVKGSGWNLDSIEPPGLPGLDLDYLRRLRVARRPLRRGDGEPAPQPPLRRGGAQPVGRDAAARLPAGEVHRSLARRRHPRDHQPGARRGVRARGAGRRRRDRAVRDAGLRPGASGRRRPGRGARRRGDGARSPRPLHLGRHRARELRAPPRAGDARRGLPRAPGRPAPGRRAGRRRVRPPRPSTWRWRRRSCAARSLAPRRRPKAPERWLLDFRRDAAIDELVSSPDAEEILETGPLTPDHVIRTKAYPLVLPPFDAADVERLDRRRRRGARRLRRGLRRVLRDQRAASRGAATSSVSTRCRASSPCATSASSRSAPRSRPPRSPATSISTPPR